MTTKTKIPGAGAALITGGAKRLGKAIALTLAQRGFDIAIHYNTNRNEAEATVKEIERLGRHCRLFAGNLADEDETKSLIPSVRKTFKNLNFLINSASIFKTSGIATRDTALLDAHYAINLRAPYILTAGFAEQCKKGQIINILDTHITKNKTSHAGYLLSKKSLADFTKMSALHLAPRIRVNGIAPGLILPPEGKGPGYLARLAKNIPLRRKGSTRNITQTVEFLLENDYLTGQIIFADGGEHLI